MEGKRRGGGGVGGHTEAFDPKVVASTPELLKSLARKARRARAAAAAKKKNLGRKRSSSSDDVDRVKVVDIMTVPSGPVLTPGRGRARGASTAEAPVVWRLPAPVPRSASDGRVGSNDDNGTTDTPVVIPDTPVSSLVQHADTQQTPSTPKHFKENTDTHQQTPSEQQTTSEQQPAAHTTQQDTHTTQQDTHTGQNDNAATPHTVTPSNPDKHLLTHTHAADSQSPGLSPSPLSSRFWRRTSLSGESGGESSSGGVGRDSVGEKRKKRKKKKTRVKNKSIKGVDSGSISNCFSSEGGARGDTAEVEVHCLSDGATQHPAAVPDSAAGPTATPYRTKRKQMNTSQQSPSPGGKKIMRRGEDAMEGDAAVPPTPATNSPGSVWDLPTGGPRVELTGDGDIPEQPTSTLTNNNNNMHNSDQDERNHNTQSHRKNTKRSARGEREIYPPPGPAPGGGRGPRGGGGGSSRAERGGVAPSSVEFVEYPVVLSDCGRGPSRFRSLGPWYDRVFDSMPGVGRPLQVRPLPSGRWLIACANATQQAKIGRLERVGGVPVACSIPRATVEGVIKPLPLDSEALKRAVTELRPYKVLSAERLRNRDGTPSHAVRVTFALQSLPSEVRLGLEVMRVTPYAAPVRRCSKCQRFGHTAAQCRARQQLCPRCGRGGHERALCNSAPSCLNCGGPHSAAWQGCPEFRTRLLANKIRSQHYAPFSAAMREAKKQVEGGLAAPLLPEPVPPRKLHNLPSHTQTELNCPLNYWKPPGPIRQNTVSYSTVLRRYGPGSGPSQTGAPRGAGSGGGAGDGGGAREGGPDPQPQQADTHGTHRRPDNAQSQHSQQTANRPLTDSTRQSHTNKPQAAKQNDTRREGGSTAVSGKRGSVPQTGDGSERGTDRRSDGQDTVDRSRGPLPRGEGIVAGEELSREREVEIRRQIALGILEGQRKVELEAWERSVAEARREETGRRVGEQLSHPQQFITFTTRLLRQMAHAKVSRNPCLLVEEFANWYNIIYDASISAPSAPHSHWEAPLLTLGFIPPPPPSSSH